MSRSIVTVVFCSLIALAVYANQCVQLQAQDDERFGVIRCGRVLNHKAIRLPSPEYPPHAVNSGAAGNVAVEVLVDEEGVVRKAKALRGHPLLREAAEAAAYKARLTPTLVSGKKIKIGGELSYNFVKPSPIDHAR